MLFDPATFFSTAVSGVPLIVFVFMFVEFLKAGGLSGKALFWASAGVGVLFGGGYMVMQTGIPADFAGYFSYAVYGLTLGFVTSLGYDKVKGIAENAVAKKIMQIATPAADKEGPAVDQGGLDEG